MCDATSSLTSSSIRFSWMAYLSTVLLSSLLGQTVTEESLGRAKATLRQAIDSGEVAGGSLMAVRQGKIVLFEVEGVRDIETKEPLQADTIMRIYSMTKPITSVAAMMLHEQGKFQLDDPIAKYISAFETTTVLETEGETPRIVPAKRQLTIRDLFRHTTGFSYGGGNSEVSQYYAREGMLYRPPHGMLPPAMTIEQGAEALAKIPALHHPGERFTYGFNTDLLGRLIEIWSDQPLDDYLQRSIFAPLEMVDTGFSVPAEKWDRLASCHTWQDEKLAIADKAATSPYRTGFEFLSGGGGLASTMQDYARFCQMLVDGGTFKGKRLLRQETIDLMFADQLEGVGGPFQFGLGFAINKAKLGAGDEQRTAAQYYWAGYASTDFRLVPEERLFVIFMRQRVPSAHGLATKLFSIIYEGVE